MGVIPECNEAFIQSGPRDDGVRKDVESKKLKRRSDPRLWVEGKLLHTAEGD